MTYMIEIIKNNQKIFLSFKSLLHDGNLLQNIQIQDYTLYTVYSQALPSTIYNYILRTNDTFLGASSVSCQQRLL